MKRIAAALIVVIALAAVAVYVSIRSTRAAADGPGGPSILLISLDTLRADALNSYGYEEFPTSPNMDAFGAENILFENAFVVEPRTLTSHMSLLTGLYPQHHHVQDETTLPEGIPTLALLLKELGYRTQAYVDDGWLDRRWGFDRGFDGYKDEKKQGLKRTVRDAVKWLKANGDRAFFLFLHTYDVHSKGPYPRYHCPAPVRGMFSAGIESELNTDDKKEFKAAWENVKESPAPEDLDYIRATYAEGVRHVDEQIGILLDYLKKAGLYDSIVTIIWADHGEGLLEHGLWGHGNVYDNTIRVPLLVKLPGHEAGGRRIQSIVSGTDLAPTILELAGYPSVVPMDGKSVLPLLARDETDDRTFTIRTKGARLFSIRTCRHHFFWNGSKDESFFFDLTTDPKEMNNLFPSGLPAEAELRDELFAWIEAYERARADAPGGDEPLFDPAIRRRLEALGYLR
jgi:arylsulfatase A-like enzyme